MILNWENKPDLKNHKDFSKETLVNSLNFFFNSNIEIDFLLSNNFN